MKLGIAVEHTRRDIIQLCHGALDSRTLRIELLKRLRTVIPFDYIFFRPPTRRHSCSPVR